jgi:hypothetical protein
MGQENNASPVTPRPINWGPMSVTTTKIVLIFAQQLNFISANYSGRWGEVDVKGHRVVLLFASSSYLHTTDFGCDGGKLRECPVVSCLCPPPLPQLGVAFKK